MRKQIKTKEVVGRLNPKIWGLFYEEINHAGDGGLYAEIIANRNFADANIPENTVYSNGKVVTRNNHKEDWDISNELPYWSLDTSVGNEAIIQRVRDNPRNEACPEQLRLVVLSNKYPTRLINKGFFGIFANTTSYKGNVIIKSDSVDTVKVGLMKKNGDVLCETIVTGINKSYTKFEFVLDCNQIDTDARFFIEVSQIGEMYIDFVSLFPDTAYKGLFRHDIFDMLKDLKPGFLRFPGGCVVEGITLENAIHWKAGIGNNEDRHGHWDLWNYRATDGLGMLEFCILAEELGADIMYVANCGMSCQARSSISGTQDEVTYWLNDCLDAIEFMIGDSTTTWGRKRCELGHPAPFFVKYVEIGNENNGEDYFERYNIFYDVLKEKYPDITLIANAVVPNAKMDMIDDHYYTTPHTFPLMFDEYNRRDVKGAKVYIGEYACNTDVEYGNLLSAISEATFMCGMERCPNVIEIASYAPLLCHEKDRKWPVNLVNFDNSSVYGIPSYYVQKLFSHYRPDTMVNVDCVRDINSTENLYISAGITDDTNELIIKVAHFGEKAIECTLEIDTKVSDKVGVVYIQSESPQDTNSAVNPINVVPSQGVINVDNNEINYLFKPCSLTIFKVKIV